MKALRVFRNNIEFNRCTTTSSLIRASTNIHNKEATLKTKKVYSQTEVLLPVLPAYTYPYCAESDISGKLTNPYCTLRRSSVADFYDMLGELCQLSEYP
ncbi:hypothetical protein [Methanosarcina sp. UBA5]|uniref:hypothetical protein n=1 Tax=Methanosarcina sp. UBA5 TaxID=1915593 RepID=UPI0025DF8F7C|nr:hypothetical protein [Methanosarcina sp. UBA5]